MYEKIVLENGIRIVYENIPYVRSAALGIWVKTGSRYETASENGASHFIEHMVFKGTQSRTAADIASLMDGIGGQINAFTTKECTCFYGRVLDTHLHQFTDILCDMFFNSRFSEDDVENERGVILEEIDMYEDSPEDLVVEQLFSAVFKGSSLARPILGKKASLSKMTGEFLHEYMQTHYCPDDVVIALSGKFSAQDIAYLQEKFASMPRRKSKKFAPAHYTPSFKLKRKSIEQNHLCLAFPGISIGAEERYAMQLLSSILGGGMSSRLFQNVRENRGLCYSIYSFGSSYEDIGLLAVYTALGRDTEMQAIEVIKEEILKLKENGVSEEELIRAREQVKANALMGLESTNARMNRLGKNELYLHYVPDMDEAIQAYDSVTVQDIKQLAAQYFDFSQVSFGAVGRVSPEEEYRKILGI